MKEERYSIIFSSKTGNTAELANAIRDALPQENCDYFGTSEIEEPVSEMLYIGFWTDQGNADKSALELLQRIKNKKVFLFGTAGFGENEAYFQKVLKQEKNAGRIKKIDYILLKNHFGKVYYTLHKIYVFLKETGSKCIG